jgi:signal peptidase I
LRHLIKKEVWSWIKSIGIAGLTVWLIHTYGFSFSIVNGHSMEPTLKNSDRLLVNKLQYVVGKPHAGDVVILKNPLGNDPQYLVKRVVAIAGDKVEVHDHQLYVNGDLVDEPYTDALIENGNFGPYVVQINSYFVMGDNRRQDQSVDSRMFNAVPDTDIVGRAEAVLWPIGHWGGL